MCKRGTLCANLRLSYTSFGDSENRGSLTRFNQLSDCRILFLIISLIGRTCMILFVVVFRGTGFTSGRFFSSRRILESFGTKKIFIIPEYL